MEDFSVPYLSGMEYSYCRFSLKIYFLNEMWEISSNTVILS